jgi:hypothetical protein
VAADSIEELDIDLGAGADSITVGSLVGSSVGTVAPARSSPTGTQLIPSPATRTTGR